MSLPLSGPAWHKHQPDKMTIFSMNEYYKLT